MYDEDSSDKLMYFVDHWLALDKVDGSICRGLPAVHQESIMGKHQRKGIQDKKTPKDVLSKKGVRCTKEEIEVIIHKEFQSYRKDIPK
ncbi:hypothetical protein MAR_036715 [Mya arenaria]|uniref:Uncharacterized protein n=1 Tax=Mya arenaria TaxID=6604 RepID=A0ABY7FQP8_MYAAR|nr:hypothetical protein MAR_036715 [Mya arenaria]